MDSEFKQWLQEEINRAQEDARESHKEDMNSFGAGYDAGIVFGLLMVQEYLRETRR